uniref:C2H2-type domain-containing protein n=1 Tax=Anopheles stephensi TaxID=30069 RepID=A0A182Y0I3_ANOST
MSHNTIPVWQVATAEPTARGSNAAAAAGSQNNGGSISTLKYVTNARQNVKIISIPGQGSVAGSNDGTLLYETTIDSSYLAVTKSPRRPTTTAQHHHHHHHTAMLNDSILLQTADGQGYLVDERSIQNIDQIPPENLIYVTSSDLPSSSDNMDHTSTAPSPSLPSSDQAHLDYVDYVPSPDAPADQTQPAAVAEYAEECQVTEEIITDDWVQSQGEECVQVTVDQLGVSTAIAVDDDISVPLDQDQYTLSRPYPCDFCSRRFRKKASLQNHLMAHSNDRPHVCYLCGAQYGRRADLINHLKQHAYADQDELSLRGGDQQDADYELPELASTAGHIKNRIRQSSEDEDLYIQNTMVSYNSQPPMQLISTTSYGTSSATIASPYEQCEITSFSNGPIEVESQRLTIDNACPTASSTSGGVEKRIGRKRKVPAAAAAAVATDVVSTARTKPATFSTKAATAVSRQIKKEPEDTIAAPPPPLDERKPFVCPQCGLSFGRAKALLAHSRTHTNKTQYECEYCNAQFYEWSLLRIHINRVHTAQQDGNSEEHDSGCASSATGKKRFSCDRCSAVFFQPDHILHHIQQAHGAVGESNASADHSNVIVKQELIQAPAGVDYVEMDGEATTDPEIEEEEYGDLDYTIEEQYENRASEPDTQHPTASPLTCRECGESFESGMELLEHSETHTARYEPHECQLCGEKFLDEATIKQHVQERHQHELTATSCAICGKRSPFSTTGDLVQHLIEHSDTNTAMKREPPTFPRKYKRRRKLNPHELERLKSGRRKQKNRQRDDDVDDTVVEEDGYEESNSAKESVKRATTKSSQHSSSQDDAALRNKRSNEPRASKRRVSVHDMLHANGINLLSNIVLLHGQQEGDEPSNNEHGNVPPESPEAKPAQPTTSSRRGTIAGNVPKSKVAGPARKKPSRKRSSPYATKDAPHDDGELKQTDAGDDRGSPAHCGGGSSTITNVMEAFFRSRKRNSLLPEIPPHRISSVSFPLLDDGNTDDPLDEPTAIVDQSRKSTTSFSASEEHALDQQLLMEISHKGGKYTERFNSDTVHDLEEILRSPLKSVVPAKSVPHRQPPKKGKGKAKSKKSAAAAAATPTKQQQSKAVEKKVKKVVPQPSPPAVLRSQRLTRRQLEREVNFLKEAYDTSVPSYAPESVKEETDPSLGTMVPPEAMDSGTSANVANAGTPEERGVDASERLAAMLLNDGLPAPDDTQSSSSSGNGGCGESTISSIFHQQQHDTFDSKPYAESLHMMEELVDVQRKDDGTVDENDPSCLYEGDSKSTTSVDGTVDYRCSICAACFDDRAQLILHVPVHI